jgi:hypothetical protein
VLIAAFDAPALTVEAHQGFGGDGGEIGGQAPGLFHAFFLHAEHGADLIAPGGHRCTLKHAGAPTSQHPIGGAVYPVKAFVALPERWIVERTIAWLNRCRRLAKDWENLNRNAFAFLKLASTRLMCR